MGNVYGAILGGLLFFWNNEDDEIWNETRQDDPIHGCDFGLGG